MNTRLLCALLWATLFLLIELPAYTCGPDWAEAVFVKRHGPDAPYEKFARGRLGVPQKGFRTRHLVVVYRYLIGLPLSPSEQAAAVDANQRFNSNWESEQQNPLVQHEGFLAWIDIRKSFGPVDGFVPENPFGTDHAWQFDTYFENCLDDAFANAARTLQARAAAYGGHSAEVLEWVRGQDLVFHNCGTERATPSALSESAPQWLRYDRAYQDAAALLYQRDYQGALSVFSMIAADTRSPWRGLSRYLVGRVMVTRAVELEAYFPPPGSDPGKEPSPTERQANYIDQLQGARKELLAMRSEARMQALAHAVNAMIDRVNARLQPDLQARVLAVRLTEPDHDPNFFQDTLDLSYLLSDEGDVNDAALLNRPRKPVPRPADQAEQRAADLLAWIKAFRAGDEAPIVEQWRSSQSNAWLVSAMTFAQPGDPAIPELLKAAAAIQSSDPAYAAVTYHRIRLSPVDPRTRNELLAALPKLSTDQGPSARNLFAELDARSAPDLDTWLKQAARTPAAEATYSEEEPFDTKPAAQPCGPMLRPSDTPLFANDAATALNTRLPLRILAQAAEHSALAPNLRFQVAQAAWTRAVLLDHRDIAMRLSPILIRCNSKWEPVLSDYRRAVSLKDRKAAALFALMRFASTEPNVREGNYRVDGFAAYSYYRDNWWCFTIPPTAQNSWRDQYNGDTGWGFTSIAHPDIPDPVFLNSRDHAEAAREIAALRAIPRASDYLPAEAFAWQKAHPHDPRAPELLGQAFRVVRNACSDKTSTEIEHQLFLTLHREYPSNHWTLRYRSWE